MSEPIKESAPQQVADARRGSLKLLAKLQAEHDCNISPPKNWKPKEPEERKLWFSVLSCVEAINLPQEPKIGDIRRAACKHFGLSSVNINSDRRLPELVYARHTAMYIARELTTRSLPEIGRHFGGRDHTTVLHGCRKIAAKVKTDWTVAFDVAHVEARLNEISN